MKVVKCDFCRKEITTSYKGPDLKCFIQGEETHIHFRGEITRDGVWQALEICSDCKELLNRQISKALEVYKLRTLKEGAKENDV